MCKYTICTDLSTRKWRRFFFCVGRMLQSRTIFRRRQRASRPSFDVRSNQVVYLRCVRPSVGDPSSSSNIRVSCLRVSEFPSFRVSGRYSIVCVCVTSRRASKDPSVVRRVANRSSRDHRTTRPIPCRPVSTSSPCSVRRIATDQPSWASSVPYTPTSGSCLPSPSHPMRASIATPRTSRMLRIPP